MASFIVYLESIQRSTVGARNKKEKNALLLCTIPLTLEAFNQYKGQRVNLFLLRDSGFAVKGKS